MSAIVHLLILIPSLTTSRPSQEDSFEKTHYRSSMPSDFVFGDNCHLQGGLHPLNQFRPVSVHSINSIHSPMKEEDDAVISVSSILIKFFISSVNKEIYIYIYTTDTRRRTCSSSIQSLIEASLPPCVHVEKRKLSAVHGVQICNGQDNPYNPPNKARILESLQSPLPLHINSVVNG